MSERIRMHLDPDEIKRRRGNRVGIRAKTDADLEAEVQVWVASVRRSGKVGSNLTDEQLLRRAAVMVAGVEVERLVPYRGYNGGVLAEVDFQRAAARLRHAEDALRAIDPDIEGRYHEGDLSIETTAALERAANAQTIARTAAGDRLQDARKALTDACDLRDLEAIDAARTALGEAQAAFDALT